MGKTLKTWPRPFELRYGSNRHEPFFRMALSNNRPHNFLMSTLSSSSPCRRTGLVAFFTLVACLVARGGDVPNWAGEFTDKKFLNGLAVFQMSIGRSGNAWHVAFDAVYTDGHGAAPEAEGPGKVSGNTLQFTFKDTFLNSGTGTITPAGDDMIVSIKPTHVAEAKCLIFYKQNIRLKRVSKK